MPGRAWRLAALETGGLSPQMSSLFLLARDGGGDGDDDNACRSSLGSVIALIDVCNVRGRDLGPGTTSAKSGGTTF